MAGRGRWSGTWAVRFCLALLVLLTGSGALTGCGTGAPADASGTQMRRLLDARARAVLDRDEGAYLKSGGQGEDPAAAARAAREFHRLAGMPTGSWEYRVTGLSRSGDTATVSADLRYAVKGYDHAPVATARTLRLHHADGRWYVVSDRPGDKAGEQLWEQGTVVAVRGAHSLVLGVGQDRRRLREFASLADHAVPAVTDAWGRGWSRRVVVLVPESLDGMAGLLGSPASGYRGIAAVTTGEVGGSRQAAADRIVVNPEAYGVLGDFGKQVVLTHETTHVATRASTSAATPLWLSEGFADWVGYRGSGRTARQAAPELGRAVGGGRVPDGLPDDGAFGFSREAAPLAEAYEGGWMACRMIAAHWGEADLKAFYKAVGAHKKRAGAVEGALADVLGTTQEKFTAEWRDYLRDELG